MENEAHGLLSMPGVGFFGMLYVVLDMEKTAIPDVAFIMLGTLAGGFSQVMTYWLGSSRGSKEKTELMASFVKR